jgi:hypothetical protein
MSSAADRSPFHKGSTTTETLTVIESN